MSEHGRPDNNGAKVTNRILTSLMSSATGAGANTTNTLGVAAFTTTTSVVVVMTDAGISVPPLELHGPLTLATRSASSVVAAREATEGVGAGPELVPEGGSTSREEYDGVPDALEGQDNGAGEVEAEAGRAAGVVARAPHVVDPVDTARRPRHEHADGEDERRPQVRELDRVHAAEARAPLPEAPSDAPGECRPPYLLLLGGWVCRNMGHRLVWRVDGRGRRSGHVVSSALPVIRGSLEPVNPRRDRRITGSRSGSVLGRHSGDLYDFRVYTAHNSPSCEDILKFTKSEFRPCRAVAGALRS